MVKHLTNPPKGVMLPSLPTLTQYLGSLRPYELTLLCAPTGSGKTALLATMAKDIAVQGVPLFCAPVETGDVDFLTRIVSSVVGVDLNNGDAVNVEYLKRVMTDEAMKIFASPLLISNYDSRVPIEEMIGVLEVMAGKGVRVALLDNLNFFLEVSSSDMERAVLDAAVHSLVMFCKKHPMHVILVVHPRKTDGGRVLSEFDIKGSSTAVQECANVMLFNRPKEQDVQDGLYRWSDREVVFKKIRKRGMYVNKPIWLTYANGGYQELTQ
jgi:hypothetical protein